MLKSQYFFPFVRIKLSFVNSPNSELCKMLRSKNIFLNFNRNKNLFQRYLSSEPAKKILGYKEKPNENEITADYIGK